MLFQSRPLPAWPGLHPVSHPIPLHPHPTARHPTAPHKQCIARPTLLYQCLQPLPNCLQLLSEAVTSAAVTPAAATPAAVTVQAGAGCCVFGLYFGLSASLFRTVNQSETDCQMSVRSAEGSCFFGLYFGL